MPASVNTGATQIYNSMKSAYQDTPDFNSFQKKISTEAGMQDVYTAMKKAYGDIPDYNTFKSKLTGEKSGGTILAAIDNNSRAFSLFNVHDKQGILNNFASVDERHGAVSNANADQIVSMVNSAREKINNLADPLDPYSGVHQMFLISQLNQSREAKVATLVTKARSGNVTKQDTADLDYLRKVAPKAAANIGINDATNLDKYVLDVQNIKLSSIREETQKSVAEKEAFLQSNGIKTDELNFTKGDDITSALSKQKENELAALDQQYPVQIMPTTGARGINPDLSRENYEEYSQKVSAVNKKYDDLGFSVGMVAGSKYATANPDADKMKVGMEVLKYTDNNLYNKILDSKQPINNLPQAKLVAQLGLGVLRGYGNEKKAVEFENQMDNLDNEFPFSLAQETLARLGVEKYKASGNWFANNTAINEHEADQLADNLPQKYKDAYVKYLKPTFKKQFGLEIPNESGVLNNLISGATEGTSNLIDGALYLIGQGKTDAKEATDVLKKPYTAKGTPAGEFMPIVQEYADLNKRDESTLTPEELKRKQDLKGITNLRSTTQKVLDQTSNFIGSITPIILATELTGGAAGSFIGASEKVVATTGGLDAIANTATNIGVRQTVLNRAASIGSIYASMIEPQRAVAADMFPGEKNATKRDVFTIMTAGINTLAFEALPMGSKMLGLKELNNPIKNLISQLEEKSLSPELFKSSLTTILDKTKLFATEVTTGALKFGGATTAANIITNMIFFPDKFANQQGFDEAAATFTHSLLDGAVMGALGGFNKVRNYNANTEALGRIGTDDYFTMSVKKEMGKKFIDGTMDQDTYNTKMNLLFNIEATNKKMESSELTKNMRPQDRMKYSLALVNENILKSDLEHEIDPVEKQAIERKIKLSQATRQVIADGKMFVDENGEVKHDYYDVLGVSSKDPAEKIQSAYEGFDKKTPEIEEAFSVISDPAKRSLYDVYGKSAKSYDQVSEEPAAEVKKDPIDQAIEGNQLSGVIKDAALLAKSEGKEEQFYKDVAQQALNKVSPGAGDNIGEKITDEAAFSKAIDNYGPTIVDHAVKLFPNEPEASSPASTKEHKSSTPQSIARKVYKDIGEIDTPTDARGLALEYLAGGGKIHESSIDEVSGTVKRASLNTGAKEKRSGEVKARDYADKNGKTVDEVAHSIWDNLPDNLKENISTEDLKNELNDVINSHNTRLSAATEFRDRYISQNVHEQLTAEEAKQIDDKMISLLQEQVSELPEHQQEQLVEFLKKYQNEYGLVDWKKLEEDTNGFDPEILDLPSELQSAIYGLVEKNIKSGQSESNNAGGEADNQKAATDKPGEATTPQEEVKLSTEETPPPPPTEEKPVTESSSEDEFTKVANAVNDSFVEGKFGIEALDKVMAKLQDTNLREIYEKVKDRIQKGLLDVKKVRERILTTKEGSEEDQAALMIDLAQLKQKEKDLINSINQQTDPEKITEQQRLLTEVQNEMMDNALANRVIGRTSSTIFRLRQLWVDREANLQEMTDEFKAAKGIKELTPEEDFDIKAMYNKLRELEAKRKLAKEEYDQAISDNEQLKKQVETLKALKSLSTEQKKADRFKKSEEAIKKSNDRIAQSKEKLSELKKKKGGSGTLKSSFIPIPEIDTDVAKEVLNIAKEKFYQGFVKLDELVRNVLDDVREIFPTWTEKEVRAHLFQNFKGEDKIDYKSEGFAAAEQAVKDKLKAYKNLEKEYAIQLYKWQKDRRSDIMAKRPAKERILDGILRWQRFAVLSYPTTIAKLLAVVAHQLTLKPLKFAIQKLVYELANVPKRISGGKFTNPLDKSAVWGDVSLNSLGKYYSALLRNFSLANIKEQFSGVDTKELLYGNRYIFDEWAAGKGLLEMPGRSHGYIKSFIKNPEFQFAHQQATNYYIGRMNEISKQLEDTSLTPEKRTELEKEYKNWDATDLNNMERMNKVALDHGKWGILMNDNKFTDKFRQWADSKSVWGAFMRSELPIVKIPVNFVSRAFAYKYGLIRAVVGQGKWEGGATNLPSMFQMIYKGTKDLKPEQADLLGKALNLGTMGAAFYLVGYFNKDQFEINDDGSVDIMGTHFSKNLVHSPELESMFAGAETAHNQEKGDDFVSAYIQSDIDIAKKNPFVNMLKYGFAANVAGALLAKGDQSKITGRIQDAVNRKLADLSIPGFLKQGAEYLDTDENGQTIKRKASGDWGERFVQTMEMGLPGLRQNVPEMKK